MILLMVKLDLLLTFHNGIAKLALQCLALNLCLGRPRVPKALVLGITLYSETKEVPL